jgi:hypothetical protein
MANAADLKSASAQADYGFESRPRHRMMVGDSVTKRVGVGAVRGGPVVLMWSPCHLRRRRRPADQACRCPA